MKNKIIYIHPWIRTICMDEIKWENIMWMWKKFMDLMKY